MWTVWFLINIVTNSLLNVKLVYFFPQSYEWFTIRWLSVVIYVVYVPFSFTCKTIHIYYFMVSYGSGYDKAGRRANAKKLCQVGTCYGLWVLKSGMETLEELYEMHCLRKKGRNAYPYPLLVAVMNPQALTPTIWACAFVSASGFNGHPCLTRRAWGCSGSSVRLQWRCWQRLSPHQRFMGRINWPIRASSFLLPVS